MLNAMRDRTNKVNSNGFALFVMGLTLAGFVGGALRLFLNSDRAQQQIILEVQKKFPEWDVQANKVELRLASGIWPGITLELPKAQATRQGSCGQSSLKVHLEMLKIPVSLWSLLAGQNRIGQASVGKIDVELLESPCEAQAQEKGKDKVSISTNPLSASPGLKNFGLRSIYQEVQGRAAGLTLYEVMVSDPSSPDWSFRAKDLHIQANSDVSLHGTFSLWKQFPKGELRQEFKLDASLQGPLLEWQLRSAIKEGELRWSGQLDEDGQTFLQRLQMKQGPLNDLLETFYKVGWLPTAPQTRRVWLNCEIVQGGSFQTFPKVSEIPLQIKSCGVDGELGRLSLESQVFYLEKPHLRNGPLLMKFEEVSLESVAEILGVSQFPLIFSSLGFWDGQLKVDSDQNYQLNGEWKGLKLNISNKSLRGVETISKIQTSAQVKKDHVHLLLSDFEILGGSRGGELEVNYSLQEHKGKLNAYFQNLKLSSAVQNLLIQGEMDPVELKLRGEIQADSFVGLSGEFSSSEARGQGWNLKGISGKLNQVSPEKFKGEVLAELFNWEPHFRYHPLIEEVARSFESPSFPRKMERLKAQLVIESQKGELSSVRSAWGAKKLEMEGAWKRGGSLNAEVRLSKNQSRRGLSKGLPIELNGSGGQVLQSLPR